MSIELALKAMLPVITATTTDTVYLREVLDTLCGTSVNAYKNGTKITHSDSYYYYSGAAPIQNPETVYRECAVKKSCMIVINPFESNPVFHDVGPLPTPEKLLNEYLSEFMGIKKIREILPSLGGLTLKEVTETLMLTEAREGYVDSGTIIKSRLSTLRSTQGLDIVSTELKGYEADSRLAGFAAEERDFFLGDADVRLRPRGIIATGPAGTGKSSAAKYLAATWGVPLFRLDAGIQSKWIGESEQNLTNALKQIEQAAPAVLLLDEIEKFFSTSSDGGVTQKLLGALLWWLQEHQAKVFTFMTTNSMDDLPPELYRPGRIDQVMQFNYPDDRMTIAYKVAESFGVTAETNKAIILDIEKTLGYAEEQVRHEWGVENNLAVLSHADIASAVISCIKLHQRENGQPKDNTSGSGKGSSRNVVKPNYVGPGARSRTAKRAVEQTPAKKPTLRIKPEATRAAGKKKPATKSV